MPTHYEMLELDKNASEHDIKKSYRKLSLQYHPDRNGGDASSTEKYKKINEAHEILSDPNKREQYNMELQFGGGGSHMSGGGGGFHMGGDMGDIFNMMFNGGMGGGGGGGPGIRIFHSSGGFPGHPGMENFFQQMNKPPPIVKNVSITLEQAYTGATVVVDIEKQFSIGGNKSIKHEKMNIQIPKGIEENEVMILREHGHEINENMKGDIKIIIEIQKNKIFKRHGMDLIYDKQLTLKESLCGFSFEIAHLNGKVLNMNNLANNHIIKPNYKKVVPGLGMVKNGQTGNLIIEMSIEFPDSLTKEQTEILRNTL